jgi:hypothetical protein
VATIIATFPSHYLGLQMDKIISNNSSDDGAIIFALDDAEIFDTALATQERSIVAAQERSIIKG